MEREDPLFLGLSPTAISGCTSRGSCSRVVVVVVIGQLFYVKIRMLVLPLLKRLFSEAAHRIISGSSALRASEIQVIEDMRTQYVPGREYVLELISTELTLY